MFANDEEHLVNVAEIGENGTEETPSRKGKHSKGKATKPKAKRIKSKNRMQITEFPARRSQHKRVLREIQGM